MKYLLLAVAVAVAVAVALCIGCGEEETVSRYDSLSYADQQEVEYGCSNPTFRITSCDTAFDKDRCLQVRYDRCLETYVPWR